MYTKSVITAIVLVILCIKFGQGLQCYKHDFCLGDACRDIENRTTICNNNETRCWKLAVPKGTARGCGDSECNLQATISIFGTANVCCSTNLCNSAIQIKMTTVVMLLMSLIGFINRSSFD